jgi:hypothetical protein
VPTIIGVKSSMPAARSAQSDKAAPDGSRDSLPRARRSIDDAPPFMPGEAARRRRVAEAETTDETVMTEPSGRVVWLIGRSAARCTGQVLCHATAGGRVAAWRALVHVALRPGLPKNVLRVPPCYNSDVTGREVSLLGSAKRVMA